jgi:hypothetical protein
MIWLTAFIGLVVLLVADYLHLARCGRAIADGAAAAGDEHL